MSGPKRLRHELVLVRLTADFPPIDSQLRGPVRRQLDTVARILSRPPATRAAIAVDFAPGRYAIICFLRDPDGGQHSLKGMSSEFRVR